MAWTLQSSTTEVEDSVAGRGLQTSPLQEGLLWVEQDFIELDALQIQNKKMVPVQTLEKYLIFCIVATSFSMKDW